MDIATVSGYINVVDRYSKPIKVPGGHIVEKIKAGAFERAIKRAAEEKRPIVLLADHDKDKVLGDTIKGTLELKEDSIGLYGKAVIKDEQTVKRLREKMPHGWSFGFKKIKDNYTPIAYSDGEEREIEELELTEVSILLDKDPAYEATSVDVRSEPTNDTANEPENDKEEYRCTKESISCYITELSAGCCGYEERIEYLRNL